MKALRVAALLSALMYGKVATAQSVAPLTSSAVDPARMPFSEVLRLRPDVVRVKTGAVRRGVAIVSIPVDYRRTGVLQRDVKDRGLLGFGSTFARAGSVGYWAGRFRDDGLFARPTDPAADLWCLFDKKADGPSTSSHCFLDRGSDRKRRIAAVLAPMNPLLVRHFSLNASSPIGDMPLMEEGPVNIAPDLRVDYTFGSWGSRYAEVYVCVGDGPVDVLRLPRAADGSATLITPLGAYLLNQSDPRDRGAATVVLARTFKAP